MARIVWEKTAQERFNQLLHNTRNMARVKSRSQNPLDWRGFGPAAIQSEYFNELCETTWNIEEWKHKSATAMKNRSSMPEASVHVRGLYTFVRHKEIMHVSQYSQNVNEGYSGRVIEKYGEDGSSSSTEPVIDMDAWLCSTGQPKKGRVYGFGRTLDPCYSRSSSSASVSSHPASSSSSAPVSEEHFLSIMRTEMRTELCTELRTEIQTQNQKIRSYVDNVLKGVVDAIKQLTTSFSQSSRAREHQKGKEKGKYRRQADDNVEDEDDDDESDEDLGDDD
ncbi:Transposase, Ptta/En/Spm, plant [Quillaja saponaria]|nr:Transposase, Ptta/En/Spm, plant [Quillaja saponaria]